MCRIQCHVATCVVGDDGWWRALYQFGFAIPMHILPKTPLCTFKSNEILISSVLDCVGVDDVGGVVAAISVVGMY